MIRNKPEGTDGLARFMRDLAHPRRRQDLLSTANDEILRLTSAPSPI